MHNRRELLLPGHRRLQLHCTALSTDPTAAMLRVALKTVVHKMFFSQALEEEIEGRA